MEVHPAREVPPDEARRSLETMTVWKLRIVLSDGRKWCVGKILGVANDRTGEATAYMFPVPENIESLNALSKLMTMMTCEKAAKGQECGSCPDLPTCPQMKAVDESLKRMAEGGK